MFVGIDIETLDKQNGTLSEDSFLKLRKTLSWEFTIEGTIAVPCTQHRKVKDGISKPHGKYPEALGNVVVIEFELWNALIRENINSMAISFEHRILDQILAGLEPLISENLPQNITKVVQQRTKDLKMEVLTLVDKLSTM